MKLITVHEQWRAGVVDVAMCRRRPLRGGRYRRLSWLIWSPFTLRSSRLHAMHGDQQHSCPDYAARFLSSTFHYACVPASTQTRTTASSLNSTFSWLRRSLQIWLCTSCLRDWRPLSFITLSVFHSSFKTFLFQINSSYRKCSRLIKPQDNAAQRRITQNTAGHSGN